MFTARRRGQPQLVQLGQEEGEEEDLGLFDLLTHLSRLWGRDPDFPLHCHRLFEGEWLELLPVASSRAVLVRDNLKGAGAGTDLDSATVTGTVGHDTPRDSHEEPEEGGNTHAVPTSPTLSGAQVGDFGPGSSPHAPAQAQAAAPPSKAEPQGQAGPGDTLTVYATEHLDRASRLGVRPVVASLLHQLETHPAYAGLLRRLELRVEKQQLRVALADLAQDDVELQEDLGAHGALEDLLAHHRPTLTPAQYYAARVDLDLRRANLGTRERECEARRRRLGARVREVDLELAHCDWDGVGGRSGDHDGPGAGNRDGSAQAGDGEDGAPGAAGREGQR
jgi:hypothetical protein